jgi:hypothetical protein
MARKPNVNSEQEIELDKIQKQFDAYDDQVKQMTLDRMNEAPKAEQEPQTKIAQADLAKSKDIYLKPDKTIGPGVNPKTGEREKFNEKFREEYNFSKEYVQFTAENKEIIGETIEMWTKPFPGTNCEFWKIPVNKPVWGPRYLAEQIKRCSYHRLTMQQNSIISADGMGQYYGQMVADQTINRLDAIPVSSRRSVFMGSTTF